MKKKINHSRRAAERSGASNSIPGLNKPGERKTRLAARWRLILIGTMQLK
jgi:hypothetical protein